MAYFNFTRITPPAPNDPTVNEVTQLNDNWDHLDAKLGPYMNGGSISGLETGQEYFDVNFRYALWDGAAARLPDDIDAAWSAWTAIPMLSPRTVRPNFTPRWRNNSLLRKVELSGGLTFNAVSDPWTPNTLATVNGDVAGAVPASMIPVGGTHVCPCATALSAGTTIVSSGYAFIDKPGGNTFTRIRVCYLGGDGGGNFVQLEEISWWY